MTMVLDEGVADTKTLTADDIQVVTVRRSAPVIAGDPTYDDEDWWDTAGEIWDDHDR